MRDSLFRVSSTALLLLFLLTSCQYFNCSDDSDSSKCYATETVEWAYTPSSPVYEIDCYTKSVIIKGNIAGKTLYLTKTNPTSSVISSGLTRYVESTDGFNSVYSRSASVCESYGEDSDIEEETFCSKTDTFCGADFTPLINSSSVKSRTITEVDTPVKQVNYQVGDTKEIYLDSDASMTVFEQQACVLAAKGTYCNVWIEEAHYSGEEKDSGYNIGRTRAAKLASTFDDIYSAVRQIYGNESDEVWYYMGKWKKAPMSYLSDTGTAVNIVIGTIHDSSTVGYFYSKDYFPNKVDIGRLGYDYPTSKKIYWYSNEGKYLYVNASRILGEFDKVLSTLAHEFTHLILYGTKYMEYGNTPDKWYDEMMAMLCEDVMQDFIGISNANSPKDRLIRFNKNYKNTGLEYLESDLNILLQTYADNYAFGAFLLRQYGGTKLLSRMASTSLTDISCVVDGVRFAMDNSYGISDILRDYTVACSIKTPSDTTVYPSFNQDSAEYASYSYTASDGTSAVYNYPVKAINLWRLDALLGKTSNNSYYKYDGPSVYYSNDRYDLRPYGFLVTKIGVCETSADNVTVTLSSAGSPDLRLYIVAGE